MNIKAFKFLAFILSLTLAVSFAPKVVDAAGGGYEPIDVEWSFEGPFGTYDRGAMQRGYKVYKQVCASCHSMKKLYYRNLEDLGFTPGQVKTVAAEYTVIDGPNDEGDMFERPARPSDRFASPFPNIQAAKYANNGAYPPDMSLLAKARPGGADYIYSLLVGYEEAPDDVDMLPGQYWNKYMPGHIIAMANPLFDGAISYDGKADETIDQYAKDLSHFLMWAAEPKMEQRKQTGLKALIFLLVFTLVMYNSKKKVWKNLK